MPDQIRHVSEIPEWFDLDKYAEAADLDAAGWYEQLAIRHDLRSSFSRLGKDIDHYLIQIRLKPIVNTKNDRPFSFNTSWKVKIEADSPAPNSALGVSVMTAIGLRTMVDHLDESRRADLDSWYDHLNSEQLTIGELKALEKTGLTNQHRSQSLKDCGKMTK